MALKVAILGYGRSGSTLHAGPIEALEDFELTAVCDVDPQARKKASERFGCRLYEDYHEMLRAETLDLIVIVTRSHQHCQMACDCLRAGFNVLVTKPWGVNAAEGRQMIQAAEESGKMLLPWLPSRWGMDLRRLRELIEAGTVGRVFQVRRSMMNFSPRCDWQTDKASGGGYLLNWGPHLVDQPVQLVGKPIKTVYGEMKTIINPGDAEDVFYAVLKTEDNVTIISEFNVGAGKFPSWVVQGDRGTLIVYDTEIEIHQATLPEKLDATLYGNPSKMTVRMDEQEEGKKITSANRYGDNMEIYAHIAQAVRAETAYQVPLKSALALSMQLDAIRESHSTGQVIRLD